MSLSSFGNWLLLAPLIAIAFVILVGMVVASVGGRALRRRHDRRTVAGGVTSDAEDGEQGMMVSAVMGLMALLVAFTFSIALDRFDSRRTNVLQEANAIGTTYLRAQLLEEPHRTRLSRLLGEYTDGRIVLATAPAGRDRTRALEHSDRLVTDLWTATVAAFPTMRPYTSSHSFLETMNQLIDMDAARKAARQAHVPAAVFLVLFLYLFVAAGFISYALVGKRGRRTALVVFVLLGVLMVLIVDIDRPTTGSVTESQKPMLELRAFLKANPPATFDRFNRPVPSAPVR